MTVTANSPLFDSVEEAIQEIAAGRPVVVTDDENRENEGDLVMAAARAEPETINLMIREAGGLICVPTVSHQLRRLGINQMVPENRESHRTDFTVSVDAAEGITTGISAYDRARTIRILADPQASPDMLVQPGHIFPLRARPGGVLERAGHTEAAVDLASLAGLHPSGVICEILNRDGTMARQPELIEFKNRLGLKMISIAQLIEYRHQREKLVERIAESPVETDHGVFQLHVFRSLLDQRTHFALTLGSFDTDEPVAVRVQSENILSDVFAARFRDNLIPAALAWIAREGRGAVVYIEQPLGGIRPGAEGHPLTAENLFSSASMSVRDYGLGAQILSSLGLRRITLLTSRPRKVIALAGYGIEIVDQIPLASCGSCSQDPQDAAGGNIMTREVL